MNIKFVATFVASAFILHQGYSIMQSYNQKVALQNAQNYGVTSLRETWASLQPTIDKWNATYTPDTAIKDLNGVYSALKLEEHGIQAQSLMLNDAGRFNIKVDEENLGLSKACLTNSAAGFTLSQDYVSRHISTLDGLLKRGDIEYGRISMLIDKGKDDKMPYVVFDRLCVVIRGSDTFLEDMQ
jgi:hypothetical protein